MEKMLVSASYTVCEDNLSPMNMNLIHPIDVEILHILIERIKQGGKEKLMGFILILVWQYI